MRPLLSLVRREFAAYFFSLIGFVAITVFLIFTGLLFAFYPLAGLTDSGPQGVEDPMQSLLGHELFWLVFAFILPLLTMRLLAEERATGTLEMLLTAPIRDWQVVAGKYLGAVLFYLVMWLPTLAYVPVLVDFDWGALSDHLSLRMIVEMLVAVVLVSGIVFSFGLFLDRLLRGRLVSALVSLAIAFGLLLIPILERLTDSQGWVAEFLAFDWEGAFHARIDPAPVISTYLGVVLAGGMFLAIGLFVSSLVRSQLVAALIALVFSLAFVVIDFLQPFLDPNAGFAKVVNYLSVPEHFRRDFTRGVIDTRHVVLYLSVTAFSLFLTVRSLEARRLRA